MLYDNPSGANTPFIPPLPSPESLVHPPPIPTPDNREPPPSWVQQPQTPMNYPYYSSTPYNTTPFIPPMPSIHSTPATQPRPEPPGSYYPAPSALPVSPGMLNPPFGGTPAVPALQVSADFTGYPMSLQGTPWAPPQPMPPPNAMPPPPWPAPHPATAYNAFTHPLPGAPWPPMAPPPMGPYTPAAWPMPPGMSPHPAYAGYTPWQHPTQQPPPIRVPGADTAQAAFRWTNNADRMGPFTEGPHCTSPSTYPRT